MTKGRRDINVQYRRLEGAILPSANFSLFDEIIAALNVQKEGVALRADWRLRNFHFDNDVSLTMNWFVQDSDYLIAEVAGVEPGGLLTAASRSAGGAFFEIGQVEPGEGREPYLGAVYFLARGNHVLIADDGLSAKRVENYLEWLLGTATDIVPNFPVHLEPKVSVSDAASQSATATTIEVRPKPFSPPSETNELMSVKTGGAAWDVLNALRMDYRDFDSLIEEAGDAVLWRKRHHVFDAGRVAFS